MHIYIYIVLRVLHIDEHGHRHQCIYGCLLTASDFVVVVCYCFFNINLYWCNLLIHVVRSKHTKGLKECYLLGQKHNLQMFGVIPFVKLQYDT